MPRGFHNLTEEKRREIASKGGKAVHLSGNARIWTTEQAREAGRKGREKRMENNKRKTPPPDTSV